MTTATINDELLEIANETEGVTVVVSSSDTVPVSVKSGDFATVEIEDDKIILLMGGSPSEGSVGGAALLGDIGNVTADGRTDGAVLEFSAAAGMWRPTTGQRNQIYDGGNF